MGGEFRHLMALGVEILTTQQARAARAPLRLDGHHHIHLLDRHQCSCLPLMAELSAGSAPTELVAGPLAHGLGRIARRWSRRSPRRLRQRLSHLVHGDLYLLDGGLQSLDTLLQGCYPRLKHPDVGLSLRWDALPHLWR
jgi:hypothetical protein